MGYREWALLGNLHRTRFNKVQNSERSHNRLYPTQGLPFIGPATWVCEPVKGPSPTTRTMLVHDVQNVTGSLLVEILE